MKVLVLGSGEMGRVAIADLLRYGHSRKSFRVFQANS
jgi:saccharopine dehydrogenase-like NADP-dependent oxidoreductase